MLKMDSGSENTMITSEEAHMLLNAFQKEEFRNLFAEYIKEVNDPANLAKYEEEMTILEKDRGYDITFLKPDAGYVMKLMAGGQKSFVNICKNDNVGIACCKNVPGPDNKMGYSWDIPMMFSKPRNELDKKGTSCMVYDVMFNPSAFSFAGSVKGFRKIMEDSALTYVEKNFGVIFDRSNIRYPKMKYKGTPSRCVLRKTKKHGSDKPKSDWDEMLAKNNGDSMAEVLLNKLDLGETDNQNNRQKFVAPKYMIKYREYADMSNYLSGCGMNRKEMIIDIDVPLVHSADELQVDTSEKCAFVQSVVPAHNYKIEISFPYQVRDTEGKAKFDPVSKKLILTLPIIETKKCLAGESYDLQNPHPGDELSEMKPDGSNSSSSTEVTAEYLNATPTMEEKEFPCKDLEIQSGYPTDCPTLDENLHQDASVLLSVMKEPVDHDQVENYSTSDFISLEIEHKNFGEVVISTESGLCLKKHARCVVRNCAASEVCEFPVLCTSGVQLSNITCEGHESDSDVIIRFQVKHLSPSSVNISHCTCNSSMEISFELLGSGCLPLKCACLLSFGINKKIWPNQISVSISKEGMSIEIKKQEQCCFYWEKYCFASHNKPMEALHFSKKLQTVVGKSAFVGVEELGSKHLENDDHTNCVVSVTKSDSTVIDVQASEVLDNSLPPQTSSSNALCDLDQNAPKHNSYSNMVIPNNSDSHNICSDMEKPCSSSDMESDVSCDCPLLIQSHAPLKAMETVGAIASTEQNTAHKPSDYFDISSQESKVQKKFENPSVVYLGNDEGASEISEKLKPTIDIQNEPNFIVNQTPHKDKVQENINSMHNKKVTYCESCENLDMVSSMSHKETLSERHRNHAAKLTEEICDDPVDMGKATETSSSDKRNSCNCTDVNNRCYFKGLVEGNYVVTCVSKELRDTSSGHHNNNAANTGQLSELHSLNEAINYEAQTGSENLGNSSQKSDITLDYSVVPASKESMVSGYEETLKTASEDIEQELLNSDDDEYCDNGEQSSKSLEHVSNMLSAQKTTKISSLFKNTIMFELD